MNNYEESITQQTTSDTLEKLTTTYSDMQHHSKVVAEQVAQLVDLLANNTRASVGAGKRSSSSTSVTVPTVAQFAAGVQSPGVATTATRRDTTKSVKGSTGPSTSAGVSAKETSSAAGVSDMETSSDDASCHVHAERGDHAGAGTTT